MSAYMLVHGAWAGGWCWDKVVPLLKQAGHKVETLDLPGHGCEKIISMETGHTSFFSAPEELARHLASLSRTRELMSPQ
jgi:alpha-beta hydrolase superfamily lysophospholipase